MAMSMYFKIQETVVYRTLSAACLPSMAYRGDDDDDRPSSCIARFWWWRMERRTKRKLYEYECYGTENSNRLLCTKYAEMGVNGAFLICFLR